MTTHQPSSLSFRQFFVTLLLLLTPLLATAVSADVSVESVDAADGTHEASEDLRVNTLLKNNGSTDSGMFDVHFYISTDNIITTGDTFLGTEQVSNIAAGASLALDESINLPAGLAVGDYFIGAILAISDGNTSNDTNVDQTAIFVFTQFIINAGLNDSWYNPITDGQGFFITVFPDMSLVTLAWFTYDTQLPPPEATANLGDPGHRWLTADGNINGNRAAMTIRISSGGLFDTSTDTDLVDDGAIFLEFNNCNEGTVTYNIPSIDAANAVPIQRVATDNTVLCDAILKELVLAQ